MIDLRAVRSPKRTTGNFDGVSASYAPKLQYLCEDPECCENGGPVVTCTACGQRWPCADYVASHTESATRRQARWVLRKHYPGDEEQVAWTMNRPDWLRSARGG